MKGSVMVQNVIIRCNYGVVSSFSLREGFIEEIYDLFSFLKMSSGQIRLGNYVESKCWLSQSNSHLPFMAVVYLLTLIYVNEV